MKKPVSTILALSLVMSLLMGITATVLAGWDIGDPGTKWAQLPELDQSPASAPLGIAIPSRVIVEQTGLVVADDFLCMQTGPITDIHVWGSWFNDELPPEPPVFSVGIFADISQEDSPTGYSMPDIDNEPLWIMEFTSDNYTVAPRNLDYNGTFYIPVIDNGTPVTKMYQYNFYIPEVEAFEQEVGTVYWLAVAQAEPLWAEYKWGWNISRHANRWNDDAVYVYMDGLDLTIEELRYPTNHYYEAQSMDLAFVITGPEVYSPPTEQPTPQPPDAPETVGGDAYSIDKTRLLTPWIVLAIAVIAGGVFLAKRRAHS